MISYHAFKMVFHTRVVGHRIHDPILIGKNMGLLMD